MSGMSGKAGKAEAAQQFSEFAPPERFVSIRGKDYRLREMSLAEKIRLMGPIAESIVRNVDFSKAGDGDRTADIQLFLCMGEALPEVLSLSVPDFKDWDALGESETRAAVREVIAINDFFGFTRNFTESLGSVMTSPGL